MTVTETEKEVIWLRCLTEDLGLYQGVIMVFCDRHIVIHLTKHQMYHERTKYIDVRDHFIQDTKVIKVKKIGTTYNLPDIMTKLVPSHKFEHCLKLLGVQSKVESVKTEETARI